MGTKKEKQRLRRAGIVKLVLGALISFGANIYSTTIQWPTTEQEIRSFLQSFDPNQIGILAGVFLVSAILNVWGTIEYAQSKGYSRTIGALIGLGTGCCCSILILALLPDNYRVTERKKRARRKRRTTRSSSRKRGG